MEKHWNNLAPSANPFSTSTTIRLVADRSRPVQSNRVAGVALDESMSTLGAAPAGAVIAVAKGERTKRVAKRLRHCGCNNPK